MSSDAQRFAQTVLDAFRAAGNYTDQEIGEDGGPSTTTLSKLRKVFEEGGDMPAPRGDTLRKIDHAAHWYPGSARELWAHGQPPRMRPESPLGKALGIPTPTPSERRASRLKQEQLLSSPAAFIEQLADRLLEVEERLDILEQELGQSVSIDLSGPVDSPMPLAADDTPGRDEEAEADDSP